MSEETSSENNNAGLRINEGTIIICAGASVAREHLLEQIKQHLANQKDAAQPESGCVIAHAHIEPVCTGLMESKVKIPLIVITAADDLPLPCEKLDLMEKLRELIEAGDLCCTPVARELPLIPNEDCMGIDQSKGPIKTCKRPNTPSKIGANKAAFFDKRRLTRRTLRTKHCVPR